MGLRERRKLEGQLERRTWLVDGISKYGFKFESLKLIHDRYERLDLVPDSYFYPELFCHVDKPQFIEKIEQAKR